MIYPIIIIKINAIMSENDPAKVDMLLFLKYMSEWNEKYKKLIINYIDGCSDLYTSLKLCECNFSFFMNFI